MREQRTLFIVILYGCNYANRQYSAAMASGSIDVSYRLRRNSKKLTTTYNDNKLRRITKSTT